MSQIKTALAITDGVTTAAQGLAKEADINRALAQVKEGLHNVKVSQYDATKVQREIEGELFDKWHEKCEVMESSGIPIEDIHDFLNHLEDAYEGIDKEMRKKMNGIKWGGNWKEHIVESDLDKVNDSGIKYGMIAFGKSSDGKFVDCMYCLYKVDFKVAPKKMVTKKEHSVLWGLFNWETVEEKVEEKQLGVKTIERIKNFFRYKALEGFYQEGLIDRINVVPSIEQV